TTSGDASSGFTITNKLSIEKIKITATKEWKDVNGDNLTGSKPDVTLALYNGDTQIGESKKLENGATQATWDN
ncbi:Cna B-type domain-containing protein, partial [Peptoniphilus sp. HMSC062D09]|uniref:Cna B-type domain-containing protein n=1 Tax=Peptoniphilus sp. HMSC062D09 TaxID=1739305 RepID=UPI0011D1334A